MSDHTTNQRSLEMVEQLLRRGYTEPQIRAFLQTNEKRCAALINEVKRRKDEGVPLDAKNRV